MVPEPLVDSQRVTVWGPPAYFNSGLRIIRETQRDLCLTKRHLMIRYFNSVLRFGFGGLF